MSTPIYRVTLVQLTPDASALAPASDKVELGLITDEDVYRLAGNLVKLNISNQPKTEPGIIVHKGDKGWRIAVHAGRLCMHKSTSLYDEYWTVENAAGLAHLPPFAMSVTAPAHKPARHQTGKAKNPSVMRTVAEVAGLFTVGVVLIWVGFRFGLPQRKLTDLPPDIVVVTAESERASVFTTVAGTYVTGKKAGESIVTISPDGRVTLGRIGADGKSTVPQIEEQARAARKGNLAVIVTSFGNIAEFPPDAVNVGAGAFRWRKLMTN